MPNRRRSGPIARTITCFGPLPVIMNPPMPTWSPVRTCSRVERFTGCEAGVIVGVAVGVAVAVAVGVDVGLVEGVGSGSGKLARKSALSFLFVTITKRCGGV